MALVTNSTKTFADMIAATYFLVREGEDVFSRQEVKDALNIGGRAVYDIAFHQPTVIETDTIAGEPDYIIPEAVLERGNAIVYSALIDGEYISPSYYVADNTDEDTPESYYISGRVISLVPVPDDAYVLEITYMKDYAALVDDTDELDFEDIEIDSMIYYAAHLLKTIDEEYEAAAHFKQMFEETIARASTLKTGLYRDGTVYGPYGGAE